MCPMSLCVKRENVLNKKRIEEGIKITKNQINLHRV